MLRIGFNICIYIFEMLIAFTFFGKNYEKRHSSNTRVLAVGFLLFLLAALIFVKFNNEIVNLTVFFLINFLFAFIGFEISAKSAIIQSVLLDTIMYCSELVVIFLGSTIIKIPANTYKKDVLVYIILGSICKILYMLVAQGVSFIIKKDKIENFKIKYFLPLFIFPVLTMATCTVFLFIALKMSLSSAYQIAIFVISLLFVFACVFMFVYYQTLIDKEGKIKELEMERQKQEIDTQYLQIIEQNNNNSSILIHDIKNHLLHIQSLENSNEIHDYVESIAKDVQGYSYIGISKNKTLDLLISKYLNLCQGKGIKIDFDVKTANLDNVSSTDISTIINNLLDNAVEATEQSKKKEISVSIFKKQGFEILKIQNSCDTAPKAKGNKLLTTKKENQLHGYGTQSVIKTVNKYDGMFDWEYSEEEKIFTVTVAVPTE